MTSKEHQERAEHGLPTVRAERVLRVIGESANGILNVATIARRVGEKPRDVYALLTDMLTCGWIAFGSADYPWLSRPVTVTEKGALAHMACTKLGGQS